jgi:D-arginine dehydrogenase
MTTDTSIAIIGGGILGISLGYHLAAKGQRPVILERESLPGQHASGKNTGMFRHLYRNEQLTEWAVETLQLLPSAIKEKWFKQTGSLIVGRSKPEHHEELFEEMLLPQFESAEQFSAVYTAADGIIMSREVVSSLCQLTIAAGAQLLTAFDVKSIEEGGRRWKVTAADGRSVTAELIVNATGAWSGKYNGEKSSAFARHLFVVSGFEPGYMPAEHCGYYWNERADWYLRALGRRSRLFSLCDAEKADPDVYLSPQDLTRRVLTKLSQVMPEQAERLTIHDSWHCFRSYSADQLPIIGFDPIHTGLYWLGAFGGFGISTGFAACRDAAEELCGNTQPKLAPFSISRF